ncbi:MAG: papain-like cysteine peptidase [Lachnospiraceae bacterium]|nr:papain-like cysteine peptidase [Lachnospiraceae bacterium]
MEKLTNVVTKIKQVLKVLNKETKRISRSLNRRKYLSFGENCLTDDILSRYDLKSFSSPFASGRSNVEYILQIEKDMYKDFLNLQFLEYGYDGEKKVVRQKQYNELSNVYDDSCMKGFEFTHHDVIADGKKRASIERRVRRIQSLKNCTLYIFYHHRFCKM